MANSTNHGGARPGAGRPRKGYETPLYRKKADTTPLLNERDRFTHEQVLQLQKSPYVRKVTDKTISYTLEFKELFWEQYQAGVTPPQIFINAGFDIDVLGDNRIYGFYTTIRRTKENKVPLTDGREAREPPEPPPPIPNEPPSNRTLIGSITEKEIRRLMHEVAYMSQELEFIKKIIAAGGSVKFK